MSEPTRSPRADPAMKGLSAPPTRGVPSRSGHAGRRWAAFAVTFSIIASAGGAGAQSLWDDPAFALYRQAVDALNNKDYAGADRLASEAIEQYPNHVLAYYLRGQAALAQSKWSEAVAALAKVTELYPDSFAGQRDLGIAYQQLGRIDDATRAYGAALKLRPGDEELRVRMALMLLQTGQAARALTDLQQLAQQETKIPEVWTALGRVAYERGDFAGAEKAFVRAAGASRRRQHLVQPGCGPRPAGEPGGRARGLRAGGRASREQGAGRRRDRQAEGVRAG